MCIGLHRPATIGKDLLRTLYVPVRNTTTYDPIVFALWPIWVESVHAYVATSAAYRSSNTIAKKKIKKRLLQPQFTSYCKLESCRHGLLLRRNLELSHATNAGAAGLGCVKS